MPPRFHHSITNRPRLASLGARLWIVAATLVLLVSSSAAQDSPREALHAKLGMVNPNTILALDAVHNGPPELIITDVAGRVRVYDSQSLQLLRSESLGKEALTPAVSGDFLGDQLREIALGTSTGRLIVLNSRTIATLAERKVGNSFYLQPTVVTWANSSGGLYDTIVMVDENGDILGLEVTSAGDIRTIWNRASGTKIEAPIVVGHLRQAEIPDLVATTADGHVLLLSSTDGTMEQILIQQNAVLSRSALPYDADGDGHDEIYVVLNNGDVIGFRYAQNAQPRLQRFFRTSLNYPPAGGPSLITPDGGGGTPALLQITESSLSILDPLSGMVLAADNSFLSGVSTTPALIPRSGQFPEVAFGLKKTLQITNNMAEWINSRGATPLKMTQGELRHDLSNSIVVTLGDSREAIVIGASGEQDGHLYAVVSDIQVAEGAWPTRTPWMTRGANPLHDNQFNRSYANLDRARRDVSERQVDQWAAELDQAMKARDWTKARDLALLLSDYNPYDPEYSSLNRRIFIRRFLIILALGGIAAALAIGFAGFKLTRYLGFHRIFRRGELAAGRAEFEEARRCFHLLVQKSPGNTKAIIALARTCLAQGDFSPSSEDIYADASRLLPTDQELLNAHARSLSATPRTTREAAAVYERALPGFPEPQILEYALGLCKLQQGDFEEAGRRFRAALRGGLTSDGLYSALCDVYLRTRAFTAKSLPVFQQQYHLRSEQPEFLVAYLTACIDAQSMDPQVEALCRRVMIYAPAHLPAYFHLAVILMQKNQLAAAIEMLEAALEMDPRSSEAQLLLARCQLRQGRRDEHALATYLRALASEPQDPELLANIASIYFERQQFDDAATEIYHRSHAANPADLTTLKALASVAETNHDDVLIITAIEGMIAIGQLNPDQLQQLAGAYARRQNYEPKAEKVYFEALRRNPENQLLIGALAKTKFAIDSTEPDSIPIYQKYLDLNPADHAVTRQLAKCHIKNDSYQEALALVQPLLAENPADEELQRLNALASLYDNRIDAAVVEYIRILERNPDNPEALVNLALAYAHKHRVDQEAFDYYQHALRIQPANEHLLLATARVHATRNEAVKVVDCFKQALKLRENNERIVIQMANTVLTDKPELLRVRWFLVEILVAYGHLREALDQLQYIMQNHPGQVSNVQRALETILGKDPNNVGALAVRGQLLHSDGQLHEALKVLEKAHQLQPASVEVQDLLVAVCLAVLQKTDTPDTRFKLGRIYYAKQDYDAAIGCFQKTGQDYRWEAESTKMLGKCFTGKGMLDLALQEYKKLVVDTETKELLYDLAQRYELKKDLVGAKTVYRQLFAADIDYKDVKTRFEMLSGSTSDPMAFERTSIVQQMSEEAARRYELLDELGRGAMGIVYRARDKELEEVVALKILPDNLSNNPEAIRRFKVEARNARRLAHPNIVRIHDIGEEMGRKYISMEYVDGSDLKRKIKSAPNFRLPHPVVLRYAIQIADALSYAHRLGIVHRDIKPANIMLTASDDVKITDFGIAKLMDASAEATAIGAVIGTPLYMSPEQVQGKPVDNRADVYSFGVLLYELFNGRPPFTEGDLAYQHMHMDPPPIEALPDHLWQIVRKCLAKPRDERWPSADKVLDALREASRA